MMSVHSAEWTADEMRGWLRSQRRGRHRGWLDWYFLGFAAVILGTMGASLASRIQIPLLPCAPESACVPAMGLLPVAWLVATAVLVGMAASLLGPLAVDAATAAWVLSLPLDRTELLAPDLYRILLIAAVVGLLSGVLLWLTVAPSPVWIVGCTSAGALAVLAAVLAQQGDGWRVLWADGLLAIAGLLLLGALGVSPVVASTVTALAATIATSATAWRFWRRARAGLCTMPSFVLARQGRRRAGLAGAVSAADAGFLLDVIAVSLGGSRPARPLNTTARLRWSALASYEVRRLALRSPGFLLGLLLVMIGTLAIPLASVHVLAAACLTLVPALALLLTSVRTVVIAPGLRRALGLPSWLQVTALGFGAILAAAAWVSWAGSLLLVSGFTAGPAFQLAWAVAATGLAGAYRRVAAPSPNFTSGIVLTEIGPVPVAALWNALTGFDAAIAMAVMVLTGVAPALCAVVATITLLWSLRSAAQTAA